MRPALLLAMAATVCLACSDREHAHRRAACGYGSGDLAEKTLPDFGLTGSQIPIDHFILVMQENRSFDHYYSSLKVPGQTVDGAAPDATNPDPAIPGGTVSRFHQTAYCFDNPAESWSEVHREINGGRMDGFTTQNALSDPMNDPTGRRAMGYYDESDLPFYYALSRTFSISDRHFASVPANTFPNRLFSMAGTAFGMTKNGLPPATDPEGNPYPNLFTRLLDANVSWKVYSQDVPTPGLLADTWLNNLDHFVKQEEFFTDAAAGNLASVTMVEGTDFLGGLSPNEDPPADPQPGQALVSRIVKAVMASPNWSRSALIITYDEAGGFYDHVVPPPACTPDEIPMQLDATDVQGKFDQLGIRVPYIVVSPYAKRGHVSHQVTDHASTLRLLEARFNLPALTRRDANAEPPFDMFDFAHPNVSVPTLPEAVVDMDKATACGAAFPGSSPL